MDTFNIGDIVKMKSGGSKWVVHSIVTENNPLFAVHIGDIRCTREDESTKKPIFATFNPNVIELVKD